MMKWYVLQSKQKETTVAYVFIHFIGNLLVIPLNAFKVTCCFNVKYHLRRVFCVVNCLNLAAMCIFVVKSEQGLIKQVPVNVVM